MKKMIAVLLGSLCVAGCSSSSNVRVLNDNPPFCQDYILTDPVTGEAWLRYNGASGGHICQPLKMEKAGK